MIATTNIYNYNHKNNISEARSLMFYKTESVLEMKKKK